MKFNVEIEIDWLHEDSIDKVVEEQIIFGIVNKVNNETMEKVEYEATQRIEKSIDAVIGQKINETYDKMMEEEIRVTDKWGETKDKGTIREIIKKRLDNAMEAKVDDRGRPNGYNSYGTRREYLINKRVEEVIEKKTSQLIKHIDDNINAKLEENLKKEIGEKLFKTLDLDKFIKKEK